MTFANIWPIPRYCTNSYVENLGATYIVVKIHLPSIFSILLDLVINIRLNFNQSMPYAKE